MKKSLRVYLYIFRFVFIYIDLDIDMLIVYLNSSIGIIDQISLELYYRARLVI